MELLVRAHPLLVLLGREQRPLGLGGGQQHQVAAHAGRSCGRDDPPYLDAVAERRDDLAALEQVVEVVGLHLVEAAHLLGGLGERPRP